MVGLCGRVRWVRADLEVYTTLLNLFVKFGLLLRRTQSGRDVRWVVRVSGVSRVRADLEVCTTLLDLFVP